MPTCFTKRRFHHFKHLIHTEVNFDVLSNIVIFAIWRYLFDRINHISTFQLPHQILSWLKDKYDLFHRETLTTTCPLPPLKIFLSSYCPDIAINICWKTHFCFSNSIIMGWKILLRGTFICLLLISSPHFFSREKNLCFDKKKIRYNRCLFN